MILLWRNAGNGTQAIVYILSSFGCAKAPKRTALRLVHIIPVRHQCAALSPQKGAHRKLPNIVREHYYSFSLPPAEHYYSFPPCARLRALSPLCHRQSGTTLASACGGAPYAPQGLEVVSLTLPRLLTLSFGCRTRKRPGMSDGDISMKCKESACGMDRSVLFRT